MNVLLLRPHDVLFFRDGRPMTGAFAGHGAAWPLPQVAGAALHAALRAADLNPHWHRHLRHNGKVADRIRVFGSLVSVGPFPVRLTAGAAGWYFPRPLDLLTETLKPSLLPAPGDWRETSSLPPPLTHALVHCHSERLSKETAAKAWLSCDAYNAYLRGNPEAPQADETCDDADIADAESTVGIAIDPHTQTTGHGQAEGMIYSAQYLRLREDWRMGVLAQTEEKTDDDSNRREDQIAQWMRAPKALVFGGQQRLCTASRLPLDGRLPLPIGMREGFAAATNDRVLVKWVLLSPAVWPAIAGGTSRRNTPRAAHPGGWLPGWIDPASGAVLLRSVDTAMRRERRHLNYEQKGYATDFGGAAPIQAKLVAALVPKPVVITGWALADEALGDDGRPGAKTTHLAVPAGAVYYFEAAASDAQRLADALNWDGGGNGRQIKNRRSTLFGEKGFGLGVCGTWSPAPRPPS